MTGNEDTDVFVADEIHGMEAYTTADRVKTRLSQLGIGNYERPRLEVDHEGIFHGLRSGEYFDGRLPTVIRRLSLDQLSALYSLYTNWYGYITTQYMLIAVERSEAIRKKEFILNHLKNYFRRAGGDRGKMPETAITDAAKTDKRYITASATYEELNALYDCVEAMRKVADQDMKVISREVTIQQAKLHKELMLNNFGNRRDEFADNDFSTSVEDIGQYGTQANDPTTEEPTRVRPRPPVPKVQRR